MLPHKCREAYCKQYPEDECFIAEPSDNVIIECADGKSFEFDDEEDEKTFFDRLERSKAAGRNLFYEELKPFEYKPNCAY